MEHVNAIGLFRRFVAPGRLNAADIAASISLKPLEPVAERFLLLPPDGVVAADISEYLAGLDP